MPEGAVGAGMPATAVRAGTPEGTVGAGMPATAVRAGMPEGTVRAGTPANNDESGTRRFGRNRRYRMKEQGGNR